MQCYTQHSFIGIVSDKYFPMIFFVGRGGALFTEWGEQNFYRQKCYQILKSIPPKVTAIIWWVYRTGVVCMYMCVCALYVHCT